MHQPLHQEPQWKDTNTEQQTDQFSKNLNSLVYCFAFIVGGKGSGAHSYFLACGYHTYIMLVLSSSECYESPQLNFKSVVESNLSGLIWGLSGKCNSFPFTSGLHTFFHWYYFDSSFTDIMIILAMDVEHCRCTGNRDGLGIPWQLERRMGLLTCL